VVCWADTVTHAEWLAEIMDTYCKTYLIAKQIGEPLGVIPDDKIDDILRRKQWMGLPDARMGRIGGDPRGGDAKNAGEIVELVKRETGRLKAL
jgi:L-fuculose-phosphate aldolase